MPRHQTRPDYLAEPGEEEQDPCRRQTKPLSLLTEFYTLPYLPAATREQTRCAPHNLENSRTPSLGSPTRSEHPDPLQCPPQGPGRTQLLSASLGGSDPRSHVNSTRFPAPNSTPGIRDAQDNPGPCHHGSASPVGTWVAPEKIC